MWQVCSVLVITVAMTRQVCSNIFMNRANMFAWFVTRTVSGSLEQIVGQDWNRGLALDHTLRGGQFPQQLELADRDLHGTRGNGGLHRHKVRLPESRQIRATSITSLYQMQKL